MVRNAVLIFIFYLLAIAIVLFFNETIYSVNETLRHVQPVLVLSNPSSTDITVQVTDNNDTATGELD